jgi:hypothetical protein
VLAAGCKVDTTVRIKVRDDGSGVVTVTAVLDSEAVKAAEAGGGKVETRVRVGDLTAAGWKVAPWARAADGSAQLMLSKPFDTPAQATRILQEISGTVGPLRDVTVSRDRGVLSTKYGVSGTLDLAQLQTGVTADPQLVANLTNQQVDVTALDQSLLAEIRDSFGLKVVAQLPGGTTTVVGRAGKSSSIDASTSVLETKRVALIVAALVLVALAVLVLLWPGRRRRRRARRGAVVSEPAPSSRRATRGTRRAT